MDPNGRTTALFSSLPHSDSEKYDGTELKALGILWCSGQTLARATAFVNLVSLPESRNISSKDPVKAFKALIEIATTFTVQQAKKSSNILHESDVEYKLTAEEIANRILFAMPKKDGEESVVINFDEHDRRKGLMENIFAAQNSISREDFLERLLEDQNSWIFNP